MKIVYCISGTFNSGGMERVLANKANYLARTGHEITIITTDQNARKPYFQLDSTISHFDIGINYFENNEKNLFSKILSYRKKQKLHYKKLSSLLEELKCDITISMFDHDSSFIHQIKDGSKKILEIHFSRYKRLQYGRLGIWKWIDRYRSFKDLQHVQKFDSFIVLTQEDKSYWGDLHNISVIPNMNSFVPKSHSLLDSKNVIAVGRYDYQKGFDHLITAWKTVNAQHPDWKLNIFGQGPLKDSLQSLIDSMNLHEVVFLKAPVKNIEDEYINSSILAMTSRYEGLPMALLEGQSCGLPLVSYACKCGPKDIIQQGVNGFLVASGDQITFANRVIEIINNDNLRSEMGVNAIVLSNNFSEEKIMKEWLRLFNRLTTK